MVTDQHELVPFYEDKPAFSSFWHPDNKQRRSFALFDLFYFCGQVSDFIRTNIDTDFEPKKKSRLGHKQIALIHIYKNSQITPENMNEIAANHGWTAKNSGKSLYDDFNLYSVTGNRTGEPLSPSARTIQNKISLFESILPFLIVPEQERLQKEINPLKIKLEKEY